MRFPSTCCFPNPNPNKKNSRPKHPSPLQRENIDFEKMNETIDIDSEKHIEPPLVNSRPSFTTSNILLNHDFSNGMCSWNPNCCDGCVISTDSDGKYALLTNRMECWNGLEQDITSRISQGSTYHICARVRVSGPVQGSTYVQATLKLENQNSETNYLFIARTNVSTDIWENLEGTFCLPSLPKKIVFYLEGPSAGFNLLIQSVFITPSLSSTTGTNNPNIIMNPDFNDGLNHWSGRGCNILRLQSIADGKIVPKQGRFFLFATDRTDTWNGIQQDITNHVSRKFLYNVTATVRIYGYNVDSAIVRVTLALQPTPNSADQYIGVGSVTAKSSEWVELHGKFLINQTRPTKVVIYLEGPAKDTGILLNSLVVQHAERIPPSPPPIIEDPCYGVNVLQNSDLEEPITNNNWFPLGNCNLTPANGSPRMLPPTAVESLGTQQTLTGRFILVTNRTQTWNGPAQIITDNIKLFLTYQVSAWVRIMKGSPQIVNVALSVDDDWVNGGQAEAVDSKWHEIGASFRIEKKPSKVMVYVQGPAPGIDVMVGGLRIFAVDRKKRFGFLKKQTDRVRKRDVVIKLPTSDLNGAFVNVRQISNSFPIGSCIGRTNLDNEDFVRFFLKNFNWAVFGNELKWYWTEPQQGVFNYADADDLLSFCIANHIQARGHCIFWEVDNYIQPWLKALTKSELLKAVQSRLSSLLSRYKSKFRHYDVNNEMLHGSFFLDRLGSQIRSDMFKSASRLDPDAILFVNDYHVEDRFDASSSPERYAQQIIELQRQGAKVGGIGLQAHANSPVGSILKSAFDYLGDMGLPIWLTEMDVASVNEWVRAEDLEVMMREAFAHPAVEGIMLWGFWEMFMSREDAFLVGAEGDVNEAGRRFLDLKEEWLTRVHGCVSEDCDFRFRGFCGRYEMEIVGAFGKVTKTFVVEMGTSSVEISVDI